MKEEQQDLDWYEEVEVLVGHLSDQIFALLDIGYSEEVGWLLDLPDRYLEDGGHRHGSLPMRPVVLVQVVETNDRRK